MGPVLIAWLYATGGSPHCDTSGECYSSPPPHIFSSEMWSLVVHVIEVPVCICHLDITAPWSWWWGIQFMLCTGLSHSVPRVTRGVIFSNLKWVIWSYVLQCDGATSLSLSKDSFIKFRGQRVRKCWSMRTTLTENLTLFSGNCPLWEHMKRNNGSSVLWWNPIVL